MVCSLEPLRALRGPPASALLVLTRPSLIPSSAPPTAPGPHLPTLTAVPTPPVPRQRLWPSFLRPSHVSLAGITTEIAEALRGPLAPDQAHPGVSGTPAQPLFPPRQAHRMQHPGHLRPHAGPVWPNQVLGGQLCGRAHGPGATRNRRSQGSLKAASQAPLLGFTISWVPRPQVRCRTRPSSGVLGLCPSLHRPSLGPSTPPSSSEDTRHRSSAT